MATYIHKKYFAVPYDANALTKMHVRQSNARNFGSAEGATKETPGGEWQYTKRETLLFFVLPAALVGPTLYGIAYFCFLP